jgi:hypothetical protein
VADLLQDEPRRRKLSVAGQSYAEQWTARAMAERMLAFYDVVLAASTLTKPAPRPI